jgi:capsular polysaccharide transport system permease protein
MPPFPGDPGAGGGKFAMDASLAAPRGGGRVRFQRLRVLFALVLREMGTSFGRSAGGYLWALGEPLGGVLLLALVFSLAVRTPPLGSSFILFYATGMMPFSLFKAMSGGVAGAVSSNKGLLTYPVVTVLDAVLAKFVLNLLTSLMVTLILISGIVLVLDLHVNLDLGSAATAMGLAALLGLGVGATNCVLFGFFPTWKNVWGVLTRPLFLISGIFFTFESVPKAFQAVLWWNPLVHVTGVMRAGFYGTYDPAYVSYPYVLGLGLGLFAAGAVLMRRHASFLIEQ